MKKAPVFVLDSDVFIAAKNAYYVFDICPGFWLHTSESASTASTASKPSCSRANRKKTWSFGSRIRFLQRSSTALRRKKCSTPTPRSRCGCSEAPNNFDRAKAKFATEADGWLVAYSMVYGTTVVTNEQPRPNSRNRVLLPDVCAQFEVPRKDTFAMLRSLAAKFDLRVKGETWPTSPSK